MPRLSAEHRRTQILYKTMELAKEGNLYSVTVKDVADALGVSHALIIYHFKSAIKLREQAIALAMHEREYHCVVAQALVAKDPFTVDIDDEDREMFLKSLA